MPAAKTASSGSADANAFAGRMPSGAEATRGGANNGNNGAAAGGGGGGGGMAEAQPLQVARLSVLAVATGAGLIITMGAAVLLIFLLATPTRRGFFCDDDSIRYPLKPNTVSTTVLIVGSVGLPILVVIGCESAWAWADEARRRRRVAFARCAVPEALVRLLWALAAFLFGGLAQQLVVDVAKYTVGRLRPHFLDACRPDPSPCINISDLHRYVSEYRCTGDASIEREARLSFPSGHSSLSFYGAVFLILYLERRFPWRREQRLPKGFVQILLLLAAWFTAVSRVSDSKHHPTDVLAGLLIGVFAAWLTVRQMRARPHRSVGIGDGDVLPLALRSSPSVDTYDTLVL